MRILTKQTDVPTNLANSKTGSMVLRLTQQDHARQLQDAARPLLTVQHQLRPQIVGSQTTLVSQAFILEPADMQHLQQLVQAVQGDANAHQVQAAAKALVDHVTGQAPDSSDDASDDTPSSPPIASA